jgi:hypothetical protein
MYAVLNASSESPFPYLNISQNPFSARNPDQVSVKRAMLPAGLAACRITENVPEERHILAIDPLYAPISELFN